MKYLTKSRFKLALECPTKLWYTGKKEYADLKQYDSFLKSLADGGYQVGNLVQDYFQIPGDCIIEDLSYEGSLAQTAELLAREQVIIAEAAFKFENLFVRADIVKKEGNQIFLYEVKAKSINGESKFTNSDWAPYVYDLAFQKYVIEKSLSGVQVNANLVLVNKDSITVSEGLNQVYKINHINTSPNGRARIEVIKSRELTEQELDPANWIVSIVNLDEHIREIYAGTDGCYTPAMPLEQRINKYVAIYNDETCTYSQIGKACSKCEFKNSDATAGLNLKSGFEECLLHNDPAHDFSRIMTFELWGGGYTQQKGRLIDEGKLFFDQITEDDLRPANYDAKKVDGEMHYADRKWHQIEQTLHVDPTAVVYKDGLRNEMTTWQFPLHMIDFETSSTAIPFNAGMNPYEQIAFQFSHHIIHKDGRVVHQGEWLNVNPGVFPNFDFVRALRSELNQEAGSVFMYSHHEKTILSKIGEQLSNSNEADKEELIEFITTLVGKNKVDGIRQMIDLLDVVKRFYWHPKMKGSNSIKQVLPAILSHSEALYEKYSQPIYGTVQLPSKNFQDFIWLRKDGEGIKDPYKLLDPVSSNIPAEYFNAVMMKEEEEEYVNNGGVAMMIYAEIQHMNVPVERRLAVEKSLLKYCELDTLAMVMLYEGLKDLSQ